MSPFQKNDLILRWARDGLYLTTLPTYRASGDPLLPLLLKGTLTREEIKQQGNALRIKGTNPIGVWNQTLISSGTDHYNEDYEPINSTFLDPDGEMVHVESWWENNGTVHKSWLRGKPRCCGGEFESTRYLQDENSLVCESVFHPNAAGAPKSKGFLPATVTWRFRPE